MIWLSTHWQPVSGLFIGSAIVALYFYLYAIRRKRMVPWIAKHVFRDQFMSKVSADSLFKVVTSFLFMIGGIVVIVALYYLTNS